MKGLILCGGTGSRLWPITLSLPKQLIPIGNKPVLFYIIDSLVQVNIRDIGIVVNHNEPVFREALAAYSNNDIKFTFIDQKQPAGLANAVLEAEPYIGNDDFIMILGDNFYDMRLSPFVDGFLGGSFNCRLLLKEVKYPNRFGVAEVHEEKIINLVEKPQNPSSNLAITGIYIFDKSIFKGCKAISPSKRGEYEITDAIKWLLEQGYNVGYQLVQKGWLDLGNPGDILEANKIVLDKKAANVLGTAYLGKNSKIINSIVIGPIAIGENSIIKNSEIGPYTSVGKEVHIENASIKNSIVLDQCSIKCIGHIIDESIVGSGSVIESSFESCRGYNFVLARNSKIILG